MDQNFVKKNKFTLPKHRSQVINAITMRVKVMVMDMKRWFVKEFKFNN